MNPMTPEEIRGPFHKEGQLCEQEWRCETWGCGVVLTLRRTHCLSFGPAKPCFNCGENAWVQDGRHGTWPHDLGKLGEAVFGPEPKEPSEVPR